MSAMIAAKMNVTSVPTGIVNAANLIALPTMSASTTPTGLPSRPDESGDDALVADHPSHLTPRHPNRAQHAELARALEHREDERVHDPEEADDDREREQHVEQVEQGVDSLFLVLLELRSRSATFASGKVFSAAVSLAVFAAVAPPAIFTKAKTFCGFGYSASKRCVETVTSP